MGSEVPRVDVLLDEFRDGGHRLMDYMAGTERPSDGDDNLKVSWKCFSVSSACKLVPTSSAQARVVEPCCWSTNSSRLMIEYAEITNKSPKKGASLKNSRAKLIQNIHRSTRRLRGDGSGVFVEALHNNSRALAERTFL